MCKTAIPAILLALAAGGCCPTTAGPTGPMVSHTVLLAAGEFKYFDVDTPSGTTQINLTVRMNPEDVFRLRQIDPSCTPNAEDPCAAFAEKTYPARPAGVRQFGDALTPRGTRTRIVLLNPSDQASVFIEITIEPRRAGCT